VYDHCILPPSPIGEKGENALKASLDAVKMSGNLEATFKSEATKLLEINQELVKLYALGTYCLMSKGKTDAQQSALHDQINSITQEVTSKNENVAKANPLPSTVIESFNFPLQFASDVIQVELRSVADSLAARLRIPENNLRANIFMLSKEDGKLRIPPGFQVRMFNPIEQRVAFPQQHGATGVAFSSSGLVIVMLKKKEGFFSEGGSIFLVEGWDIFHYSLDEMAKVAPDLTWIFSAPIKKENGEVIGVLNVDCVGIKSCETITEKNLAAQGERPMRIAATKIGTLLQSQLKTTPQ